MEAIFTELLLLLLVVGDVVPEEDDDDEATGDEGLRAADEVSLPCIRNQVSPNALAK